MKKKLMMVAVLLGALSLGACVDNDESASVEAVRNAKAEQLKGLAALANAQARTLWPAAVSSLLVLQPASSNAAPTIPAQTFMRMLFLVFNKLDSSCPRVNLILKR